MLFYVNHRLPQSIILGIFFVSVIFGSVFSYLGSLRARQQPKRYSIRSEATLLTNPDIYSASLNYLSIAFNDLSTPSQIADFCSAHDLWSSVQKFGLSGAAAGACRALSRGFTYPFDTMKTFEQSKEWKDNQQAETKRINYFNGILTTVVSAVPSNAVFLVTYKCLLLYSPCFFPPLLDSTSTSKLVERLAASIVASLPANAIKIPSEVVKQRAQLLQSSDIGRIVSDAVRENGIGGLYAGGYAQLLREIPYNAIQMAFYDMLQDLSTTTAMSEVATQRLHLSPPLLSALLGLVAASFAALCTQPADVIKTRLMTAGIAAPTPTADMAPAVMKGGRVVEGDGGQPNRNEERFLDSVIRTAQEILKSSGAKGFFVGLGPRLAIVSVGGASYFYATSLVETYLDITIK